MSAVAVDRLCRVYERTARHVRGAAREVEALRDVTLRIERGELFGLLGPNGAGKTTFVKVLATILLPTAGKVSVLGYDVVTEYAKIRPRIGLVLGGDRGLYWRLSGWDNLQYFADLYHVPPRVSKKRISELLEVVGLADRAHDLVETYSRGMKQRLHIARSLVADPDLIIMDEPTIGLDPVAARAVRALIRDLHMAGKTVLLTTHYMYEADELCDRVAVLHRGRVLMIATPEDLKRAVSGGPVAKIQARHITPEHLEKLRRVSGIEAAVVQEETSTSNDGLQNLVIHGAVAQGKIDTILDVLTGAELVAFRIQEPTLEDAYVKLVGGDVLDI